MNNSRQRTENYGINPFLEGVPEIQDRKVGRTFQIHS